MVLLYFFSACLSQEHSECRLHTTVPFFQVRQKAGGPPDTLSCPLRVFLSQFFFRTCGTDLCTGAEDCSVKPALWVAFVGRHAPRDALRRTCASGTLSA
mmetsp:Transcript_32392/g.86925  ORF Transcript_32392/g.86925 Transcript_32392/m.86925 type:complete len:99 (-) Transcript_32392:1112-1408(-)